MTYWQNKRVLITGASSGLGKVLAEVLAAQGAKVVLAARGQDRLDSFAKELIAKQAQVLPIACDVTNQSEVDRLFAEAVPWLGGLDLLLHCAGRSARSFILNTPPEEFTELLDLNLVAAVRCTQAAQPHLIASAGHLVLIGSLASKIGTPMHGAYPASKFALAGYAQQLRIALRDKHVHVLLVCPGPIARREGETSVAIESATDRDLPDSAKRPGAGAKVNALDPEYLARRILRTCEKRKPELVLPGWIRLLLPIGALSPSVGEWILRKFSSK